MKKLFKFIFSILFMFILVGCSPSSPYFIGEIYMDYQDGKSYIIRVNDAGNSDLKKDDYVIVQPDSNETLLPSKTKVKVEYLGITKDTIAVSVANKMIPATATITVIND